MKEKIETIEGYKDRTYFYRRYFDDSVSTENILEVFEKMFPKECKVWSRELIGGNRGAHSLNNNND